MSNSTEYIIDTLGKKEYEQGMTNCEQDNKRKAPGNCAQGLFVETPEQRQARCVDVLCAITMETDKGIKRICDVLRTDDSTFPPARTIREWIKDNTEFAAQYARAKEFQIHHLADQIIEIADDSSEDEIFVGADDEAGFGGKRVMNSEFVQRSKLRMDARKWIASKLLPKVYGDKVELSGPNGGPIQVTRVELVPLD